MTTIVCLAIKDHPRPNVQSIYGKCDICSQLIWIAADVPHFEQSICIDCFNKTEQLNKLSPRDQEVLNFYNRKR